MRFTASLIGFVLLGMVSCKKDSDSSSQRRPLIKEHARYIQNVGTLTSGYTYQGDRVDIENFNGAPGQYEYYDDKVIANVVRSDGSFWYRETYEFDNKGYVNKRYRSGSNSVIYYYKVRPDGFLESEYAISGNTQSEFKYHYNAAGLLDSVYRYSDAVLKVITIYTEYDLDRAYTCESENFGKSFLGKKFIHPPLKYKTVNMANQVVETGASTYSYDDQGRVIKDEFSINNHVDHTDTYVYY